MNNLMRRNQGYNWPFFSDIFDVDRFFGNSYYNNSQGSRPAVNISENDKEYNIDVFAPGFKKEDFSIEVDEDMLHIKAENRSEDNEEKKNFTRKEYHYNSFTRSFRLPDNVKDDKIGARYEEGVLKLTVPKSGEAEVKAKKQIRVS